MAPTTFFQPLSQPGYEKENVHEEAHVVTVQSQWVVTVKGVQVSSESSHSCNEFADGSEGSCQSLLRSSIVGGEMLGWAAAS